VLLPGVTYHLCSELWKKETQYVRNLQTCVNKYLVPLREDPKAAKSGLGPRELTAIFQNIEVLHLSVFLTFSHR
jgi:hypothetical protein